MRGFFRVCVAVVILSGLLYVRNCLAGLLYSHGGAASILVGGDRGGLPSVQDPLTSAADEDPFGTLFKTIVKSLEEGKTSDIEHVRYSGEKGDKAVVVARRKNETTDWVEAELPDWQNAIYTVDDQSTPLHTTRNKGHEANVYLTYIIENYDRLPSIIAFLHSHHKSWHTDAAQYDNGRSLQTLNLDFVRKSGYANLRCLDFPGCPDEIQPWRKKDGRDTEIIFAGAWQALFNNTDVPDVVAAACCAQFAVSREQVWKRSRAEYIWYHQWLMETRLEDDISGRVFEYLWHIIFGKDPVYCPAVAQCYSDVYNIGLSK